MEPFIPQLSGETLGCGEMGRESTAIATNWIVRLILTTLLKSSLNGSVHVKPLKRPRGASLDYGSTNQPSTIRIEPWRCTLDNVELISDPFIDNPRSIRDVHIWCTRTRRATAIGLTTQRRYQIRPWGAQRETLSSCLRFQGLLANGGDSTPRI